VHKYELGGYFHGHPKAFQEGCTLLYDNSGPALVISLPGLTSEEAKHIQLEAKNGQIKALRYVGLGTEISREMIRIIRKQGRTNHVEHYNKLKQIYRKYSCEDMANKATARYQVGGRL